MVESAGKAEGSAPAVERRSPSEPEGGWIQSLRKDNDRVDTFYVQIDSSEPFKERLRRVLSRLWLNGYDAQDLGTVTYDGYHYLLSASASVSTSNEMRIGSVAGYEEWLLELVLAHEYRHMVQHDEAWQKIAASQGLDASKCSLKKVMSGRRRCPEFEPVAEAYDEWNSAPWRHFLLELDAYHFAYEYFQQFLEPGLDAGRVCVFLQFLQTRLGHYMGKLQEYQLLYVKSGDVGFVTSVLQKNVEIVREIMARLKELGRPEVGREVYRNVEAYHELMSNHLKHPDGTSYTLRERLVVLQGAVSYLSEHVDALSGIAVANPGNLPLLGMTARTMKRTRELDDLLNRQTFGYHYQLLSPYPHRVAYRNDDEHTLDGALRLQNIWEVDFDTGREGDGGGDLEVKLGADLGIYIPWGERAFFKIAPMLYAGVNSEHGFNPIAGGRLDLRLHYDLDWGQRWGTSVSVGYAVGAHLGFGGLFDGEFDPYSDAYDKADVSLEVFRF